MTSTNDEPEDQTLPDDPIEERRSRLRGIARLFAGMVIAAGLTAATIALVIAIMVKISPNLVIIEPGTTPVPEPTPTVSQTPTPAETITLTPSTSPRQTISTPLGPLPPS